MANSEQIKSLIKSHANNDNEQFYTIVMQIAANEAKNGHTKLAKEMKDLIDKLKTKNKIIDIENNSIPIFQPKGELENLVSVSYPKLNLSDMILKKETEDRLIRIKQEHQKISKIKSYGLSPRRKILLTGLPGTGKTMSAKVLAGELNLPLFLIRLDGLITKYMGETASKLKLIFDAIAQIRGVYLFDEFDSIGSHRRANNDVGEMRRILNSFLQFIENDNSISLIIAATNHIEILDEALFRRFDDVIKYDLPDKEQMIKLLRNKLETLIKTKNINYKKLADDFINLSYAEINRACEEAIKEVLIFDLPYLNEEIISKTLKERQIMRKIP